jgi:hypothetical protein
VRGGDQERFLQIGVVKGSEEWAEMVYGGSGARSSPRGGGGGDDGSKNR